MYILVNDFEEDINIVRMFPKRELLGMALLEPIHGKMFFSDRGRDGVLLITRNPNYIPKKEQRVNILPFRLLGYQTPEEFYVPRMMWIRCVGIIVMIYGQRSTGIRW